MKACVRPRGFSLLCQAAWFFTAGPPPAVNTGPRGFFTAVSSRAGEEGQTNADMKGKRRQRRRGKYGRRKDCPQSRETATASRGRCTRKQATAKETDAQAANQARRGGHGKARLASGLRPMRRSSDAWRRRLGGQATLGGAAEAVKRRLHARGAGAFGTAYETRVKRTAEPAQHPAGLRRARTDRRTTVRTNRRTTVRTNGRTNRRTTVRTNRRTTVRTKVLD